MKPKTCFALIIIGGFMCSTGWAQTGRHLPIEGGDASILSATISGPAFHSSQLFAGVEDLASPLVNQLRENYGLDKVVQGETSEFRKMLKLRHWVHTRWHIDNDQKFDGDVFDILEKAKTGAGFHCSHAMKVQHAAMTSMGFVARDLGVDCNHLEEGRSIHHGVSEVWSNEYAKWVLMDAKYDIHFERIGVPLSASELHEAARADGGPAVQRMQGPDRKPVPMKGLEYPTSSVMGYWWVSYYVQQKTFTPPYVDISHIVISDNDAFQNTTWYRQNSEGPVKHWAYAAGAFVPTRNLHEIEWTPGVPDLKVRQIGRGELDVRIESVTPNFKAYLVRIGGGKWQTLSDGKLRWKLKGGENRLQVRTQNMRGVNGPIATAIVTLN